MADVEAKKAKLRNARIKAVKAAKKLPTAILLQRKVECDAKALKIVERLIETQVEPSWMLLNLSQINRSHLEDIIEERAIQKLCGYALCDNALTKVVNNKYKISTLRNKVYDIQKTKNFCSFWCYSATEYLLEQMLTSPLWLRAEEEIPEFQIFDKPKDKMKNPPGVEVNIVGLDLPSETDSTGTREQVPATHECNLTGSQSTDTSENSNEFVTKVIKTTEKLGKDSQSCLGDLNELARPTSGIKFPAETMKIAEEPCEKPADLSEDTDKLQRTPPDLTISKKIECEVKSDDSLVESVADRKRSERPKPTKSEFTKNTDKSKRAKQRPSVSIASLTSRVEKSVGEWITKHTIDLLHGDDSTRQRLLETLTLQDKYGELCKKLNTIQIEESKEDRVSAIQSTILKPAPHFSVLKQEAESLEVKVRAFYKGSTVIEPKALEEDKEEEEDTEKVIPLTPAHAPMALRRRIFLDKLNKVLPDLLGTLSGPGQHQYKYTPDKTAKVKALVSTFMLSATNIVFKTAEWTLVAFLIIKILSVIDGNVKDLLTTKQANMYMSMILMSYQLDCGYLDRIVLPLITKHCDDSDDHCEM